MSLDSVLCETQTTPRPKAEERSEPLNQSMDELSEKQLLAQTLNPKDCESSVGHNSDIHMCEETAQEVSELQNSDTKVSQTQHKEEVKRRRTRRSKKRKWQRLEWRHKRLQWSESTEQEVKRLHMKVVEHGQPLAPYNTTQFIMNEHNCDKEIDFEGRYQRMRRQSEEQSGGHNNDDDFYSSPEDESEYLQQQFHEAYDNIHAERLSSMNKNELIDEYLQLEDRVDDLERRLKESTAQTDGRTHRTTSNSEVQTEQCSDGNDSGTEVDEHFTKRANLFQQEIKRLTEENQRLRCDNERLERILNERPITTNTSDQ